MAELVKLSYPIDKDWWEFIKYVNQNSAIYNYQRSSNLLKSLIRNSAFGQPLFCGMAEILKNNLKFIRPLNRSPIWLIR